MGEVEGSPILLTHPLETLAGSGQAVQEYSTPTSGRSIRLVGVVISGAHPYLTGGQYATRTQYHTVATGAQS